MKLIAKISSVITARLVLALYLFLLGGQFYFHQRIHHQELRAVGYEVEKKSSCCSIAHLSEVEAEHTHVAQHEHFCKFCDKIFNPTLFSEGFFEISGNSQTFTKEFQTTLVTGESEYFSIFRNKSPPLV